MTLCSPALIYIIFSLTQIIIDIVKGLYNTAILKGVVSILITFLLDVLCKRGMGIISWVIVFIPFIFMTVITTVLLYIFGLDAATGKLNKNQVKGGNLIFSTSAQTNTNTPTNNQTVTPSSPQFYSTDPQYESFTPNVGL